MSKQISILIFATVSALVTAFGVSSVIANSTLTTSYAAILNKNSYLITSGKVDPVTLNDISLNNPHKTDWISNTFDYFAKKTAIETIANRTENLSKTANQILVDQIQTKVSSAKRFILDNPTAMVVPVLQNTIDTVQKVIDSGTVDPKYFADANELLTENNAYFAQVVNYEKHVQFKTDIIQLITSTDQLITNSVNTNNVGRDELTQILDKAKTLSNVPETSDISTATLSLSNLQSRLLSVKQAITAESDKMAAEKVRVAQENRLTEELKAVEAKKQADFKSNSQKTYRNILLNLTEQRIYRLEGDTVLDSTEIVSGMPGYDTVVGTFAIYEKSRNIYLNSPFPGITYHVFVNYWMPFYSGYGIHDSPWRSAYGGDIHLYNGSHGCSNTPPDYVAKIWDWAEVGTTVQVVQ